MKKGVVILLVLVFSVSLVSANWFTDLFSFGDDSNLEGELASLIGEENLIAHYKFENNVQDSVGSNDGTNNGASFVEGIDGKAGSFDGVGDYVSVSNFPNFNNAVTISAWVKTNAPYSYDLAGIVERMNTGEPYHGVELGFLQEMSVFHAGGLYDNNLLGGTDTKINDNEWHQIVGVFDGAKSYIYVDGILKASDTRTNNIYTTTEDLNIGHNHNRQSFFKGVIDEVKVWNKALNAGEVKSEYDFYTQKGLIAHYKFENNVQDSVGSNDGTNNGASFVEGIDGRAGSFDGVGDYVSVSNFPNFNNAVTISAWVKTNAPYSDNLAGIVEKMNTREPYQGVELGFLQEMSVFHAGGLYENNLLGGTDTKINDNEWHQVVGVFDGSKSYIYVDGILKASDTRTNNIYTTTEDLNIGSNYDNSLFFKGVIDEVKIWNKALSTEEIEEDYTQIGLEQCTNSGGTWIGTTCCGDIAQETYSEPGQGNGCCFNSVAYESNTILDELTFLCLDGQWYHAGPHMEFNPEWSSWAKDSEICKEYGDYSRGTTGMPYGGIFPKRKEYMIYGDLLNFQCGEDKYCSANKECVSCLNQGDPCTAQTQDNKEVFGFYFYWYDWYGSESYKICKSYLDGYIPCDDSDTIETCKTLSVLEKTPIFGRNDFIKWNNPEMYKTDFIRMKRSGIDNAILIGWQESEFDFGALPHINDALRKLDKQGKEYPKITLFDGVEPWFIEYPNIKNNLDNPEHRTFLINKIADRSITIFDGIDDKYEFFKDGKRVLWFYVWIKEFDSKTNCELLGELKQEFDNRDYPIFLVAPTTMGNCEAIDARHNWAQGQLPKAKEMFNNNEIDNLYTLDSIGNIPVSDKIDICEVSPGFERPNAVFCGVENLPNIPRDSGDSFRKSWDSCLNKNEGWIVVQTWNEYYESTNIAPSIEEGYLYNEINVEKVNQFKGTNLEWVECEIDEECFINGAQNFCINNECVDEEGVEISFVTGVESMALSFAIIGQECESTGLRQSGKYCSFNETWVSQKVEEETCKNNFECGTNVCVDGECISAGLFRRFLEWLKGLFR